MPPALLDFGAHEIPGNKYVLEGRVIDDDDPAGLTIQFRGVVNTTTTVLADGTFSLVVDIPLGTIGFLLAQTTDIHGAASNVGSDYVFHTL